MPSDLLSLQQRFTVCVAGLINYANSKGWKLTFGDTYRDPAYHPLARIKPEVLSCHAQRLAVDFNLFIDGQWIKGDQPDDKFAWMDLGKYWESLDPLCRWGGNWNHDGEYAEVDENDFNHFSITYGGTA